MKVGPMIEVIAWISFWFLVGMIGRGLNNEKRTIGKRGEPGEEIVKREIE